MSQLRAFVGNQVLLRISALLGLFCPDFYSDIEDFTQILCRYLPKKLAAKTSAEEAVQNFQVNYFFRISKTKSLIHAMENPCLELEDPKLAKRVMDFVGPLVINAEKQEKMIEVLEKELDLGLQHGLSGQTSLEIQNNG